MGNINVAIAWAISIAQDDTHGYDQEHRQGPDYDCSSLVANALHNAGYSIPVDAYTGNIEGYLRACNFRTCSQPWVKGDIHLKTGRHVCMSINSSQIVEASSNENGEITGGQTGDQTGREIWVHNYYEYSGGWDVHLRAPDSSYSTEWHAKPSGGYGTTSPEYFDNIKAFSSYFFSQLYAREAITGMLGNVYGESGLNPWLWQSNTVSMNLGYGLFQFTPASDYINGMTDVPNYAPNLSVTEQTTGANANDAIAQMYVFSNDLLGKWNGSCWRSYWNPSDYPDLYQMRADVLNTYGNGTTLTMQQFSQITDIDLATFAFLACYEGPAVPNYSTRYAYALAMYPYVTDDWNGGNKKKMPLYMFLRRRRY